MREVRDLHSRFRVFGLVGSSFMGFGTIIGWDLGLYL